jgi:hypothetical protein
MTVRIQHPQRREVTHPMGPVSDGDLDLIGWLCTHLPRITAEADEYRWRHKLDTALADIRAGTPVAQALAGQHLSIDLDTARNEQARIGRGDPATLDELNIDPVEVTGDYGCPGRPGCSRRAQPDADGHEPRCGLYDRTMILQSR